MKRFTLETINPALQEVQVPILGSLPIRAAEIQREMREGTSKPFSTITSCHLGDLQAAGRKPCTYLRQVAALCAFPDLLHSDHFPEDTKQRARDIMKTLDNGSVGGYNLKYVMDTLPRKIARYIEHRDGGVPCDPENIIVSGGASQAILTVLSLLVNPEGPQKTGILVSIPYYPIYADAIALHGAVMVRYPLDEARGWAVDVDAIRESLHAARKHCDPKVLCVINPGNPTGQVLSKDNMEDIIRLAVEENLLILADEVYQENVFAPGVVFHSFKKVLYEMGPDFWRSLQLVSLHSLSKGISAECGLRSGYVEFVNVDPAVFQYLYVLKPFTEPSVIGAVSLEALMEPPQPGEPSYQTFMEERQQLLSDLLERSRLAEETLNRAPGIHCNPIQAALYAFPRIHIPERAVTLAQGRGLAPDVFFCHLLLEETGIVLVDGSSLGQTEGNYHVRISLLQPMQALHSTLQEIVAFHGRFLKEYS